MSEKYSNEDDIMFYETVWKFGIKGAISISCRI